MKVIRTTIVAILPAIGLFAQNPPPHPAFEEVSVLPSSPAVQEGVRLNRGQLICTGLALKDYIAVAYGTQNEQIEGPAWIDSARFDIRAKLSPDAVAAQVPAILQAVLFDTFGARIHRESKDRPAWSLRISPGTLPADIHMKASPLYPAFAEMPTIAVAVAAGFNGTTIDYGRGSSFSFAQDRVEARKLSMATFAEDLARFLDRPLMNLTGLQGAWDLTLELSPSDFTAMNTQGGINAHIDLPPGALQQLAEADGDSLFNAIKKLGLTIEPLQTPVEMLVIDSIEQNPRGN